MTKSTYCARALPIADTLSHNSSIHALGRLCSMSFSHRFNKPLLTFQSRVHVDSFIVSA